MNRIMAFALASTFVTAAHAQTLQRQGHDHTIYTVHGSADELGKFQEEVGSRWKGGVLLNMDKSRGISRYWAFSDRTASQAREFIFGSMMFGVKLDIEAYEEQRLFPVERAELDSIALHCGFTVDPFFISPQRELQVRPAPGATLQAIECALTNLKSSKALNSLPTSLVGNEALPEELK